MPPTANGAPVFPFGSIHSPGHVEKRSLPAISFRMVGSKASA